MSARSLASSSFTSAPSLPSSVLHWGVLSDLSDDIAQHLSGDAALGEMAQACRAFAWSVYKVRYRRLDITGGNSDIWRSRVLEFAAQHNNSPPWGFEFVRELTIVLDTWHRSSFRELIQLVHQMLTGVHTIHVFGYESLCPTLLNNWFSSLLDFTQPTMISFNGSVIPQYVLEFNVPSIQIMEFNSCRIFYPNANWEEVDDREKMIDAHLVLTKGGSGWSRVESVTSSGINSETLRLLQKTCGLPSLILRLTFHQNDDEIRLYDNISSIQHLTLHVPGTAVEAVPSFFQRNLPAALSLRSLEIVFEPEFDNHSTPYLILDLITPTLLAAAKRIPHCRLTCISFRFSVPENVLQIGTIEYTDLLTGIRLEATNGIQQPLRLPIQLPSDFEIPFTYRTPGNVSWADTWLTGVPWGNTTD